MLRGANGLRQGRGKGMTTLERIEQELNKVREERKQALEQDKNSELSILEGWEGALVWVKRIIKEGERV